MAMEVINGNDGNNNGGGDNGNNGNYGRNGGFNRGNMNNQNNNQKMQENGIESFPMDVLVDSKNLKTHYEILCHRPNSLQQAFKTAATIEINRKVVEKVSKRDDPKLYNSRVPKKDELT
ncbi:uncharacterized protein LOC131860200 [Cryptomeria japonica]|uniref:uncharacterized protein LOC131860200 n=1 Tax=Cryptomeria japonica TaxID=3369 RepID=UPI0027DA86EE|nr:uncharacterized protein LOC131860200 [Cryptomeria japonica]